jgi:hypothetical protein
MRFLGFLFKKQAEIDESEDTTPSPISDSSIAEDTSGPWRYCAECGRKFNIEKAENSFNNYVFQRQPKYHYEYTTVYYDFEGKCLQCAKKEFTASKDDMESAWLQGAEDLENYNNQHGDWW